jgi:hypothetical protein
MFVRDCGLRQKAERCFGDLVERGVLNKGDVTLLRGCRLLKAAELVGRYNLKLT